MLQLGASSLSANDITALLLGIAILLGLARILGERARRYRQPSVLGEILAGIILGPTIFGALSTYLVAKGFLSHNLFELIFPLEGGEKIALDGFITISATLLLFVVGLEVDLSTVIRQGKEAIAVSLAGIVLPFTFGFVIAWYLPDFLGAGPRGIGEDGQLPFAIFLGIAMSITALPVIAKILLDLNIAKSDMGMLIISSAMLNDLVGWIGFAIVLALLPVTAMVIPDPAAIHSATEVVTDAVNNTGSSQVVTTILITLVFLALMLTLGRLACHKALPYVQARWSWPGGVLSFVICISLICAAFTEYLGIHSIFGAFVAGVAIGDSTHLSERTRDTINQFIMNIFSPIFFASIGLRINFISEFNISIVLLVLVLATVGKVSGSYFGARLAKLGKREASALSFGMAAQGAVGIILGQLAREAGLINDELMVAIVVMALTTSLISGPIMQIILRLQHQRKLIDFLTDKQVIIDPTSTDIMQTIGELSKRAAEITNLKAHDIYKAVLQRERIMHTGLPGGLAVPHARLDNLPKPCVVIARHRNGIDFDAPDGKPAQIIGLLLTPTDQPETQIELLSLFAKSFSRNEIRQRALEIKSPTEFLAVLNQAAAEEAEATSPH
ncbi:PTS system fructose-specific EIIABC component [Poriferisphaera corsica]|uniref:PTS system fructose-specific EIIABC component n=1 Tax=Poriferisphaera corsica TaxID=2528020 RepID=A0A517YTF7_9BACT|nr:cation:proton antiporter [Poriferisphaera corsica]QDU33504.1 PTS system fructose-specific EIIABC component [Poriferisphaera corsica]